MAFCTCDGRFGNTGLPSGIKPFGITKKLIVVPTFDNDGNRNSILASDFVNGVLPATYVEGKINEADASKRWYPISTKLKNVTQERAESINEDFDDGSLSRIRQGAKPFAGMIVGADYVQLDKLTQGGCESLSFYAVDECGNLRGTVSSDGTELFPTKIEDGSWDPIFMEKTDTTDNKIMLNFQYEVDELDSDLRMVSAQSTESDVKNLNGLIDVLSAVSGESTTGFTVDLSTCYGDFNDPIKFKGRVLADFELNEVSPTPGAVVILTLTETSDGVYDLTFAAETSGDVLQLTLAPAVTGFELEETLITIP